MLKGPGREHCTCLVYIGSTSAGKERGVKVVQLFPEEGNLGLVLPKELSKWTTDKVRNEGIEVHPGNTVETAAVDDGKVKVKLSGGEEVCLFSLACAGFLISLTMHLSLSVPRSSYAYM